jgi:thiol-disulfide isomerase/thioredoxin
MIALRIKIWIVLSIWVCSVLKGSAQALVDKGLLIKGHIDEHTTPGVSVSGAGLELLTTEEPIRIPVDKDGNFNCWMPSRNSIGHLSIFHGENPAFDYYIDAIDSVSFTWSDPDMATTLQVNSGRPGLDRWMSDEYRMRTAFWEKQENRMDTCTTAASFERIISRLNKQQFGLLETYSTILDSFQYDRAARNIFYGNMTTIVNSKWFAGYDFSDIGIRINFPPLWMGDHRFRGNKDSICKAIIKKNPTADTAVMRKMANGFTIVYFSQTWNAVDTMAFKTSWAYRQFIYWYVAQFYSVAASHRFDKNLYTPDNYSYWLAGIIKDRKLIDWLTAGHIYEIMRSNKASKTVDTSDSLKYMVRDRRLQNELTYLQASMDDRLLPGEQAPDLSFGTTSGTMKNLSSFKGKYVFLNFWSSACGPCIEDIRLFSKKAAEKYAGKNVVILYISMDANNFLWQRSLQQYKPAGVNGRIVDGFDGKTAGDYHLVSVPRHVIINPDGLIINSDAEGLRSILETNPFK